MIRFNDKLPQEEEEWNMQRGGEEQEETNVGTK